MDRILSRIADGIISTLKVTFPEDVYLRHKAPTSPISYTRYMEILKLTIQLSLSRSITSYIGIGGSKSDFRENIKDYIMSGGLHSYVGENALDFRIAEHLPDSLYEVLKPIFSLELTNRHIDGLDLYRNFFAGLSPEAANFIKEYVNPTANPTWLEPQNVLRDCELDVNWISSFLKYIAMRYGKIRIYGYGLHGGGFGTKIPSEGDYQPVARTDNVDDAFGKGSGNNHWYYELEYDPATGDFVDFDLDDFKLFLGALMCDEQTFVIRSAPDNPIGLMAEDEILFAFNLWTKRLEAHQIAGIPSAAYVAPTTPGRVLKPWNEGTYRQLADMWQAFMNFKRLPLLCHYKKDIFLDLIRSVGYLNPRGSGIEYVGNPEEMYEVAINQFNEQGVDHWFDTFHWDKIKEIRKEVEENRPDLKDSLKVLSIASYITITGDIKHIIAINGQTSDQTKDPYKLTKFIEDKFKGDDNIVVAYTPTGQRRFIAPKIYLHRKNHAEVKIFEKLMSEEIAPNSRIYLTADKVMCVTCRMVKEQYEILNSEQDNFVEFYSGPEQSDTDYPSEFPSTWTEDIFKDKYRQWFIENEIPNYETILDELWEKYKNNKYRNELEPTVEGHYGGSAEVSHLDVRIVNVV